jgi:glycosyltransferase involved in cell wall biosynthesis
MKVKGYKLVIAGCPDDKEYFEKIKNMAAVDSDIEIIKALEDEQLIKLYQNCYAVLFTAKNEDWGIVPLEAMACGKPVIAVNEGGVKESIINNKTGFLVEAIPEKICEKMLLLTNNPHLTKKMGEMGIKHSVKFDWSFFTKKFEDILMEIK